MKITPRNIILHELIGLYVRVIDSRNKYLIGLRGVVIDETRNTLVLSTDKGVKIVPKAVCSFEFRLPSGLLVRVEGRLLVGRPEDRIKRKIRRRW
ncbi:MAG: ribonuclease P protein subunit [Thermoprotei archaeon]|nr:MAG: ribonuclease P protein subunit [Thermoprotei archaeon]